MNINEAKENLRKYLPLLRELEEVKRNTIIQSKVENLLHEIWRNVVGYEGLYMVSNFGRVKSFYGIGERLLTPSATKSGYQYTVLTDKNKIRKSCLRPHTRCASFPAESRKQTRSSSP